MIKRLLDQAEPHWANGSQHDVSQSFRRFWSSSKYHIFEVDVTLNSRFVDLNEPGVTMQHWILVQLW